MAAAANFALDGDARLNSTGLDRQTYIRPQNRKLHDHTVSFEEYHYYANLTRAAEDQHHFDNGPAEKKGIWSTIFPSKSYKHSPTNTGNTSNEKIDKEGENTVLTTGPDGSAVSDEDWINASRAMRTASWSAVFYLITTDILGPFGVPFAIGTLGWGPGVALYTVFGFLAAYSGYLLWTVFLGLDSDQYPLKSYGDLAFRLYGRTARHCFNFLQSVQLLCSVGVIIVSNGQALSQVSKFRLCYAICCLLWAICGFFVGQVRTLQKYGWLANAAIWMNVLIIFISMGVIAHSEPNYAAAQGAAAGAAISGPGGPLVAMDPTTHQYPAVVHNGGLPDASNFIGSINGLMQGVYAFGGAMLFNEFMSEMRRPRDFLKALAAAQSFIYVCYMIYGLIVYHYQGQYANTIAYQGITPYAWQTVCNILGVVSGLIAAGLYGNIGIKVIYHNLLVDFFHAPPLTDKRGKWLWFAIVPVYWSVAFIVAASIPNFFSLTSLVASICIMQFTYSFPPLLALGYFIKKNAMQTGEGFDPVTGTVTRFDNGVKRWARGFVKGGRLSLNVWNVLYMLGALTTAGLGAYSAVEGLIATFQVSTLSAFTCHSPLDNAG